MLINKNLYDLFRQQFPNDQDKAFITDHSGKVFSYHTAEIVSAKLANYLLHLGLKKGDVIAVQVEKSPEALIVYLAAIRAGLVYLPLNTGYTEAELTYFLDDAQPGLIVCDPDRQQQFQQLASRCQSNSLVETLDSNGEGSLMLNSQTCTHLFDPVSCEGTDLAAILYTSGTTGQPKGAMLSHDNLASNAFTLADLWGWRSNDVLLHALPIFHVHGLFVACHCVLAVGASMLFLPSFDSQSIIKHLPSSTVMMGVPTFYTRLLADKNFTKHVCCQMRLFISGSAPMLEITHQNFKQRTGQTILERYGMTETGMLVSNPLNGERRPGTVGFPLPEVQVRVVNAQQKKVVPGEVGSIQVKGPNVFQGYWKKPEKTAQEFTQDGFFITGDQGIISDDGYISIVGRAKDMVITGGYNVYPKEIETVIDKIEGVKESAVFGVEHADFGEAVSAVVVCEDNVDLHERTIIQQARKELAAYKTPKSIKFLHELPRNTMGKVQKNQLRKMFSNLV